MKLKKYFNDAFYYIETIFTKNKLSFLESKELCFKKQNNDFNLWNFININDDYFVIQNKANCFVKVDNFKVICDKIHIHKATRFKLIHIYFEVNQKNNSKILDKEPIDIFIKYIDLRDPNLKRNGIHQIEKDYDNEELRYSIRSILINIPWVRKIFILMPNDKVRYFKDYNQIKKKIIYVKDKDLLGFESSNSLAFQFRIWKMKKFGISDNIIVMDDDCFITNKLEKKDFFYVKNDKVFPSIITSNFLLLNRNIVEQKFEFYKFKTKMSKEEQNEDIFNYSKYLTFLFIFDLFNIPFNKNIFVPKFTHNAIPLNLKDIKEIYYLIYNSQYKYETLDSLYRQKEILQFQTCILSFIFIKYNRRVNNIPYKLIFLNWSIPLNLKYSLLCINKGAGNYTSINYYNAKIIMEYLFPIPSNYEIIDYSLINLSFNVVYMMDKKIKEYEIQLNQMNTNYISFFFKDYLILLAILFFIKYNFICIYY